MCFLFMKAQLYVTCCLPISDLICHSVLSLAAQVTLSSLPVLEHTQPTLTSWTWFLLRVLFLQRPPQLTLPHVVSKGQKDLFRKTFPDYPC